ncbi:MAG: 6,7-dimethyl-8-ribityllumazine synthase [Flaviaesturariibacter sp.]|nr:6,7-dimethyl-8-ribityllumazine synthase [Flaviaesturariibacter sp.]
MADVANSTLLQGNESIRDLAGALVVLVKTEWNAAVVDELERGSLAVLHQNGIRTQTLVVPGAVEIPFAIRHFWKNAKKKERPAGFIALGCVVRGDTPHFEYVCQAVTTGVTGLNLSLPVPTIFGVLTVNTQEQAEERIGGRHGHKGEEAAVTVLKMMVLARDLKKEGSE